MFVVIKLKPYSVLIYFGDKFCICLLCRGVCESRIWSKKFYYGTAIVSIVVKCCSD